MVELLFDKHARCKSLRDRIRMKDQFIKRALLASGLRRRERTNFRSKNPNKCLIIRENQAGNDTNGFDNQIVATIDNVLEYECVTTSQH